LTFIGRAKEQCALGHWDRDQALSHHWTTPMLTFWATAHSGIEWGVARLDPPGGAGVLRAVPDAEPAQDAAALGIGGPFLVLGARSCSHVAENSAASNHGSSPVAITTSARVTCLARSTRI
jgi:hypothetical protein